MTMLLDKEGIKTKVDEYILEAKNKIKREFVEKHNHPFLVKFSNSKGNLSKHELKFKTIVSEIKLADILKFSNSFNKIEEIFEVKKTDRNLFSSKIIVGRTSTQDIIIDDLKISKFHAYFQIKDGTYYLCDPGSTNGTFINGLKMDISTPTIIKNSDVIIFADNSYTFFAPESAYETLKNYN